MMRENAYSGRFLFRYLVVLEPVLRKHECKTLLDYGCGKGVQWQALEDGSLLQDKLGVIPTLYDPGWPKHMKEPKGKYDIVVMTQVLGNIPKIDAEWFFNRLESFAEKAIFIGERTERLSKRVHPDHEEHLFGTLQHKEIIALARKYIKKVPVYVATYSNGAPMVMTEIPCVR
jgi:hypothetical protein